MWKDISKNWQAAFKEAWISFCNGCTPIGASLSDENDELLLSDHNRNNDAETINKRTSHAEACLIRRLDTSKYNPKKVTLYTTMEPCPMCMGMIIMSNIKRLRSAARDTYCGMMHLLDTEPYYIGKQVDHMFENDELELIQLVLQSYYELRHIDNGQGTHVFDSFKEQNEKAVTIAQKLYSDKKLDQFVSEEKSMEYVYDYILSVE